MHIEFSMRTVDIDARSTTEAAGVCHTLGEAVATFNDFLHNHGTNFNDFDEFHCRFVEDKKE